MRSVTNAAAVSGRYGLCWFSSATIESNPARSALRAKSCASLRSWFGIWTLTRTLALLGFSGNGCALAAVIVYNWIQAAIDLRQQGTPHEYTRVYRRGLRAPDEKSTRQVAGPAARRSRERRAGGRRPPM